ncbi:MAG: hypothetical protein PUE18_09215 [Firmicutes bacterium]|nr:hypothetical protein [Bacillota bacterium]
MSRTSFIYLNTKHYDGTVFVTQIADWLRLYSENGITFMYFHQFYGKEFFRTDWKKSHLEKIRTVIPQIENVSITLPEKFFFPRVNAYLLNRIINTKCKGSDRVVIFSRMLYGKEIKILKRLSSKEIVFIYDARGASKAEHEYDLTKKGMNKVQLQKLLNHISEVERDAVVNADRIFCVSNVLMKYLSQEYGVNEDKFFIYPCLSDSNKFYYSQTLRENMREKLGYNSNAHVYLYSGGLKNKYHLVGETLEFLNNVAKNDKEARFLFLSKDEYDENELLKDYSYLKGKITVRCVPNEEVVNYLNAADFGLLFRDNVIMNNVASPSKFAEYILCGLPTIISEGVGDYSELCVKENLGIKIKDFKLTEADANRLIENDFSREKIAFFGSQNLSKQSRLPQILMEFKRYQ